VLEDKLFIRKFKDSPDKERMSSKRRREEMREGALLNEYQKLSYKKQK